MATGTKVATAVLEIRTDTGTFKADLSQAATAGTDVGKVFAAVGKVFDTLSSSATAFAKGFDNAGQSAVRTSKNIKGAVDETTKSYEDAGTSFGKLVAGIVSAEAIIGGAKTLWNGFTGEIERSLKAAGDAEKAHAQVTAALRAQGTAVPSVEKAYLDYASALQKTTIFQDDALEGAEALLTTVGNVMPRDMKKALEATTELASGLGKDLNEAAMLVSKAAEGNVAALKKSGITIDETKAKAEGFGYVLDAITAKFGGQAAAIANTYEGRLAQLANTWNNVEESIGRAITTNATVIELLGRLNSIIDTNTGELRDNAQVEQFVSDVIIGAVKAFILLLDALDKLNLIRAGVVIGLREIGMALGDVGIFALRAGQGILIAQGQFQSAGELGKMATALVGAVQELRDRNAATTQSTINFGNALGDLSRKADALAKDLEKTRGQVVGFNADTSATQRIIDGIDGSVVEGIKYYLDRGKSVQELAKMYGLLPTQVAAVKKSVDDEAAAWARHTVAITNDKEAQKKLAEAIDKIHAAQREGFGTPVTAVFGDDANLKRVTGNMSSFLEGIDKVGEHTDDTISKLEEKFKEFGDIIRNSKIVVEGVTIPIRMGLSSDEADKLFGSLGGESTGLQQFFAKLPNVKPQVNVSGFDLGKSFGAGFRNGIADLPSSILKAIQGGGNVAGAIAGTLGSSIGDAIDKSLQVSISNAAKNGMGKLTSSLLSGLSGMIPVVGSLIGPLIDKLFSIGGPSKAELAGRKLQDQFQQQFKSFDDMVNSIGKAYAATGQTLDQARTDVKLLLDAEKQGPDAVQAIIDKLQGALDQAKEIDDAISGLGIKSKDELQHAADVAREAYEKVHAGVATGQFTVDDETKAYRAFQQALADMGDEAAKAWLKVHDATEAASSAGADAFDAAQKKLEDLIGQRDDLTKAISAEAPEEVEGVIQQQQEKQRDSLDAQIKQQADQYAQLAKDTGQEMADSIKEALERLHITIDVGYNLPELPDTPNGRPTGETTPPTNPGGVNPGETPEAIGDYVRVSSPRRFLVGEAGPEDAVFGGAGRNLAQDVAAALGPILQQSSGGDMNIRTQVILDGHVLGTSLVNRVAQDKRGLGTKLRRGLGLASVGS